MSVSIKEYRKQIDAEKIKDVLMKYGIEPVQENGLMILYPTVCHNPDPAHASHKLYYYKKDRMFKCYTECDEMFDVFQLIININALRGNIISLRDALSICGIDTNEVIDETLFYEIKKQLNYLFEMNNTVLPEPEEIKILDSNIMNRYIYNMNMLTPWIAEGITPNTLMRYGIKYDSISNAIVIPYHTKNNELIGVRGRFLGEDAKAKYMPMKYGGDYLAHPTSQILYGLNINYPAIQKHKMAIIFEGEKSVMKMDTLYGDSNVSVAVSGKTISQEHIKLLLDEGVKDVVLAFDRDYTSHLQLEQKLEEYAELVKYMKNFFNVSIIVDYDLILPYKESPIDAGKTVFETLMKTRVYL